MANAAAPAPALPENEPQDKNLQSYANHQTKIFDALRASIKREGNMFLFGEPTPQIVKLMYKLYHENIIRNLATTTDVAGKPNTKLKAMFGILQDSNNNLYVTISESPGYFGDSNKRTDPDYDDKKIMVNNLLRSANVTIHYPEYAPGPNANARFGRPNIPEEKRWRKGVHGGDNENTIPDADTIRGTIDANPELKNIMDYVGVGDNIDIYKKEIRNLPMVVNYVDSVQYLKERSEGHATFRPFKKYKQNAPGRPWKTECNNGHLCTESKLFAYAKYNNLKIKSFVAYWIGNLPWDPQAMPPKTREQHIIRGYCYRTQNGVGENKSEIVNEKLKLVDLRDRCSKVITKENATTAEPNTTAILATAKFNDILKRAVQPIAVACPGCFANIRAYLSGDMKVWNMSNCYVSRTSAPDMGGGKRKTRRAQKGRHHRSTYRRRH